MGAQEVMGLRDSSKFNTAHQAGVRDPDRPSPTSITSFFDCHVISFIQALHERHLRHRPCPDNIDLYVCSRLPKPKLSRFDAAAQASRQVLLSAPASAVFPGSIYHGRTQNLFVRIVDFGQLRVHSMLCSGAFFNFKFLSRDFHIDIYTSTATTPPPPIDCIPCGLRRFASSFQFVHFE